MSSPRVILLTSLFLLPAALVLATSNYEYGSDEYVTVSNGISPDGKWAITAHGSGQLGYDNFHLYLSYATDGKNVGALEEVKETLDTGADAFAAKWSKDSQQVTIVYRVDRHAPLKAISYRITGRGARRIKGPFDVRNDDLIKYWHTHGSGGSVSPRIFRIPTQA